ncbi:MULTISPECIES: branched-chain amino acid ABC transporter permease [unclassified Bradyrhizobium]|uniref:branched-chain amino acid ABC transporter permease n=1 Tax=unclassified Bradyrhizobium TaxID=2631580 RepID=UPI001FF12243|nr:MULTISPECIES: branched-chain amino acid ABC transporter permease [unclassified Bradyrhizobium]MCJ9703188.1 branched-chain amino acid ABC transporter permease [Bradyrhizobium sp. SHOUNA76]MCJ9731167.1 branched-chain amino acid ABC transporter permease [Bradyrhizobium sp. PRIMUS42]
MRTGDYKQTYGELVALIDSPPIWLWSAVLLMALIAAPYALNAYALSFLMIILITVTGALGLNILTGYTGLISLGHVGFLVTGAYAYAILTAKYHLPPLIGFLGAGLVPALASLIVGAPSLRLKGLYLAITTLAFSFIINTVILEMRWLTNGARGLSVQRPEILGISFDSDAAFTYLCLGVATLTLFATLNIRRSRVGRAFVAIRDNDTAARVMGINLHAYKLLAFVTSAFITGLAGALYGIYLSFVSVEGFPFLLSIEALAILIVGGLGSALGAVLGTVLIVLLPEAARLVFSFFSAQLDAVFTTGAQELKSMLYGLVIILFLRFQPRGLVGAWHDIRRAWVNWPLRY